MTGAEIAAAGDRRPGRPRATGHDERIVDGVLALLERGEEITVARVVEASGVSRAAIYRRWPSMTELVAAALDRGREPYGLSLEGDLLENLLTLLAAPATNRYSHDRLRMRLRLALTDVAIARAYWSSHVARRRTEIVALVTEGIARGELQPDLDVDAAIDLLVGVIYYQYVVRGVTLSDAEALARCQQAIRVAWRGMSVGRLSVVE
ncbi:TetR/AcrR family transcriptional regulator [Agrococcus baldri]|uniref:HTH tetR-type domain-containing protein n=1 Tax=Agrococcus baldri TaxID=153730 RepID=A0AA87RE12_9MICO|nr:TetR/AcrR family transcriptional regulator [Agrococcus baldri]GEK81184.1 hypothetical protein ABA31_25350 [Agrococcus baldri]